MNLIDKLAALFGRKTQPIRDGYFESDAETPAEILRRHAAECDDDARRAENSAKVSEGFVQSARKAAIGHRNLAAEYRAAADALERPRT